MLLIMSKLKGPAGFGGVRLEPGENNLTSEQWKKVQSDEFAKPHIGGGKIHEFQQRKTEEPLPEGDKELKKQLTAAKTKITKLENSLDKANETIKSTAEELDDKNKEIAKLTSDLDEATQ